jgi:hypothetical protein
MSESQLMVDAPNFLSTRQTIGIFSPSVRSLDYGVEGKYGRRGVQHALCVSGVHVV